MNPGSDWTVFVNSFGDFMIKIVLAAFLGGLFGLEREVRGREAGLRTNMMIALASCLFTYLGVSIFPFGEGVVRDPARVAAQIVSGVGFLGAGALLVHKNKVRGMTTAAAIWLVAAVGMAVGAGAYFQAVFTTILALVVLVLLAPISKSLDRRAHARFAARREVLVSEDAKKHPPRDDEGPQYWLDEETD